MTVSTNYFTGLIKKIRTDLVATAIADGLPEPTDEEVQAEMNRVFGTMENKVVNGFVLRRSVDDLGNSVWLIENILFSPLVSPIVSPFPYVNFETLSGILTLSSESPELVIEYLNVETLSGILTLSSESPDVSIVE